MPETWIALLRGINVGGSNKLPMTSLRATLVALGAVDIQTYIQSGNAVFRHAETNTATRGDAIGDGIERRHGFRPGLLLMTADQLAHAAKTNPFAHAEANPKTLHLYFLAKTAPAPDVETMRSLASNGERFRLTDRVFYLHAPNGLGRSKLAQRVERLLGVEATARNWRTVNRLLAMAQATAASVSTGRA